MFMKSRSWLMMGMFSEIAVAAIQESFNLMDRPEFFRWTRRTAQASATARSIGRGSRSEMASKVASRRARASRSLATSTPARNSAYVMIETASWPVSSRRRVPGRPRVR